MPFSILGSSPAASILKEILGCREYPVVPALVQANAARYFYLHLNQGSWHMRYPYRVANPIVSLRQAGSQATAGTFKPRGKQPPPKDGSEISQGTANVYVLLT